MPRSTRNYLKAAKHADHHVVAQTFHFFNDDDRESIEVAYREAADSAAAMGAGVVSVWRMPKERGAWSRGTVSRGVPVVGEGRGGADERSRDGTGELAAGLRRAGLN